MKQFVIKSIIAFLLGVLSYLIYFSLTAHAQESLSGIFTLNLADETATYTEHNDFSNEYVVKASAHVGRNPCNYCLEYFEPSACLEVCNIVVN